MKKLRYLFILIIFISICMISYNHLTVHAVGDLIYGNYVYRTTSLDATIKFNSTISGTYYYMITDNSDVPSVDDIKTANNSGEAVVGINTLNINSLSSGIQYCYIIVSNETTDSNIITISMPYNFYYFDDFEIYNENALVSSEELPYNPSCSGTGASNQKVIINEQIDGANGKVLQLQGTQSWAADAKMNLVRDDRKHYVFELSILPVTGVSPGCMTLASSGAGGMWTHSVFRAGLGVDVFSTPEDEIWYGVHDDEYVIDTETKYTNGNWYTLKIELDRVNNLGYVSLDGVLLSEEGFAADPAVPEWFTITGGNRGNNTAYFDNIRLYSTDEIDYHSVTFNPNGGSAVERQDNIADGEPAIVPSRPTKANAAFAGWYSDSELTTPYDFSTPITRDITLFAKWVDIVSYDLWIGNTQVTNANAYDVLGDNKVSYSVDTNTVILNNASITGAGNETTGYGIKYSGTQDLSIDATGSNTIIDDGTRSDNSTGLLLSNTTANVVINVNADSTIAIAGSDNSANSSGIASTGDVTINNNGTVDITGGNETSYSYGINTQGNIIINGGKTNVIAATATNESIALNANGDITLNSGELFAKTTSELETGKALSKPIVLNNGIVAGASNSILGSDIELYNNTINTYKWFEAPFDESRIIVPDTPSDEVVKGESEETGENESSVNPKTLDKNDAYIGVLFTSSISLLILWLKLKFINKIHS